MSDTRCGCRPHTRALNAAVAVADNAGRCVLIDLGGVVTHLFVPEERELYRLERLWGDAPVVLRIA